MGKKVIAKNKKAYFDYEIITKFEAGIVLKGSEIKSIRAGNVNLKGGFVRVFGEDAYLMDVHISPYKYSDAETKKNYDEKRQRKLVLHKKEVATIANKLNNQGVGVVPLEIYLKGGLAKVLIGIGKGKKKYDKRETIKKRDLDREARGRLKR